MVGVAGGVAASANEATAQETVTIDMTDSLVFDPDDTTVAPGTTVVWENVGEIGHSVTAYEDDIPEDAEYFASGGFRSESAARGAWPDGDVAGGETYEYTFEVTGTYEYFCIPHEGAGMVASLDVVEGGGGEETAAGPVLPENALTLGVATTVGMLSVLSIAYFLLKYGGDYELSDEDGDA
jgi:plastocyanin